MRWRRRIRFSCHCSASFFALEGLSQLLETVDQVRQTVNPGLDIQGIVLTMFDSRNNLAQQVVSDVRLHLGIRFIIPHSPQCAGVRGTFLWQAGHSL